MSVRQDSILDDPVRRCATIRPDLVPPLVICVACGYASTDPLAAVDHLRGHEATS